MPRDLTFDGFFECGRAGFFIGAEDGEEERPQSGRRLGVSGPFHFDDLAEFGVCGYFVELETHCLATVGDLCCSANVGNTESEITLYHCKIIIN